MLIIFGLAALALLAVFAVVLAVPTMIALALVRARRRRRGAQAELASDPDSAFVDIVRLEWPGEDGFVQVAGQSSG
jgi:hypothetical protein